MFEETTSTLDEFLAQPHVMRESRKTERALAGVENGAGSIEDVNMFYALVGIDFELIDRFVKVAGRCISSITAGHARALARTPRHALFARTAHLALRLFRMRPRSLACR